MEQFCNLKDDTFIRFEDNYSRCDFDIYYADPDIYGPDMIGLSMHDGCDGAAFYCTKEEFKAILKELQEIIKEN